MTDRGVCLCAHRLVVERLSTQRTSGRALVWSQARMGTWCVRGPLSLPSTVHFCVHAYAVSALTAHLSEYGSACCSVCVHTVQCWA
jgi:hypothetical protein